MWESNKWHNAQDFPNALIMLEAEFTRDGPCSSTACLVCFWLWAFKSGKVHGEEKKDKMARH